MEVALDDVPLHSDLDLATRRHATLARPGEQQRLNKLGVRERDPADIEAGKKRCRVDLRRRLVPDHLYPPVEMNVHLVGDDLRVVPAPFEPLLDAVEGVTQVEEIDVLFGARRIEILQEIGALRARLVCKGEGRPGLLKTLLLHKEEEQVQRGQALLTIDKLVSDRRRVSSRLPAGGSSPCRLSP